MSISKLDWNEEYEIDKKVIKQVLSEKAQDAILTCTQFLKTNKIIIRDTFLYQTKK